MSVDIATLNVTLSSQSYLGGCYPSAKDAETFEEIKVKDLAHAPHVRRWYNHMCSFTERERASWKAAGGKEAAKEEKEAEDEDFDVFGEEDSEEERKREEDFDRRAKEAQARIDAKKAKSGKVEIAKSMCILDVKPYDSDTNLDEIAAKVVAISMDGLKWGECLIFIISILLYVFVYY